MTDTTTPAATPSAPSAAEPPASTRPVDVAQYGLAAFLVLVGGWIVVDAASLEPGFADQVVPPSAFPYVVGAVLALLGVALGVLTARGDRPDAEDGEDVDLTAGADWRTVALLVVVFAFNIALVDVLGWAITGAVVFAGAAWVLGSRTPVRDVAIGAALSVGTWYGFYVGLGIPIPAGVLDGVL